ncbi:MAG TPA: hypothetical protein P5040_04185 [Smithella sp.]|nr:hypothetical protein [Smithella sp.]HRS97361.1 hypothetical protein [Smithella sp.]
MEDYDYWFDVFGKTLHIYGNGSPCLKDLSSWYAMPRLDKKDTADLTLEISEVDEEEIENLMPIPGDEYKINAGIMLVNEKLRYSTYADAHRYWTDYEGVGRILLDFRRGAAVSLIRENAVFPTYQKYLFADHPLNKLLPSMGIFSLHASCVAVNGKGIAFTGNSGSGKSTAAFALMQHKMPILTDERLFVFRETCYTACSISDIIKVNEDALSKFFSNPDCRQEYDVIGGEHYLKIGKSDPPLWRQRAELAALCLLEQTGKEKTEILPVNPTKLIGGLFPVTLTSVNPQFRAAKFNFIAEMLGKIECRLVKFGTDMDDFASRIEELSHTISGKK